MNSTSKFGDQKRLILACSGGVDSMVLFHLLLKKGVPFEVAHVNYQLRGEDSNLDEELVKKTCNDHGITFHLKKTRLVDQLEVEGGNLQNEARKIRHAFFRELLIHPQDKIVLAHHQDDQVEHFFLNLGRGANINGLAGMKMQDGQLLRPLLNTSRATILHYAHHHQIEWREDVSNAKNDYGRNKLRNVLLPELLEINPQLKDNVLTLMQAFRKTQTALEQKIQVQFKKLKSTEKLLFQDFDGLSHDELLELLRQINLKGIFAKELNKLRHAENEKFLFVAKQKLTITKKKDHFLFSRNER